MIIRYYLSVPHEIKHLESTFRYWINKTLGNQIKGISALTDVEYQETSDKDDADIIANLVPQSQINQRCGFSELSCSIVQIGDENPDVILFSLENWMGKSNYKGNIRRYREYLINHEFLHCRPFHLTHPRNVTSQCSFGKVNEKFLPVMYQQSKGLPKNNKSCKYNSWPLPEEFK